MSKTINDKLVAELVLDDSQFKKYAQETLDTLGRFEEKLNKLGTADNLKNLGQSIATSMSTMTKSIEAAGKKYSWLEQIAVGCYRKIGEAVTHNLSNDVMKITGVSEAVTGWRKYESEVESVQSIMNATGLKIEDVEEQLKKLSWYTDETSFHYSDMVANIAKFNAAGVKDLGQATNSMIGIANMAGYFGVNANKATHAMEGFAKAMGKGYMDNDSWQWIQTAGMNAMDVQKAFVDTAVQLGKIKKLGKNLFQVGSGKSAKTFTYEQFKNELATGWLDKAVMNATFSKYSKSMDTIYKAWIDSDETALVSDLIGELGDSIDETTKKAFIASQETKTFSDAVGALEEAVSSGWRTTFKYIFGNYEEARDMWSDVVEELFDIFVSAGYERNSLLKGWYEKGGRDELLEGIANMWYGIKAIIEPIKEAFDEIFPSTTVERLLELTEKFKGFSEKFRSLFDSSFSPENNKTVQTIEKIVDTTETFEDACARTKKNLDKLYDQINRGQRGTGWDRWKSLGNEGYVWQIVQNEVNRRYNAAVGYEKYAMHEIVNDGIVKLQTKQITTTEELEVVTEELAETQKAAEKRANDLMKTMRGLFSAVDMVKDVFSEAVKFVGKFFSRTIEKLRPTFDKILDATSKWGEKLYELREKFPTDTIAEMFDKAADKASDFVAFALNYAIPGLIDGLSNVRQNFKKGKDLLEPFVTNLGGGLWYAIKNLPGWIKSAYNYIKPIADDIYKKISPFISTVKTWIKNDVTPFVQNLPKTIVPFISNTYQSGKKFVVDVWNKLVGSEGMAKFKSSIKTAWTTIKDFGKNVWKYLSETGGEYVNTFSEFFAGFKDEEGKFDWAALFATGIDWVLEKMSGFITLIGDMIGQLKNFYKMFEPTGDAEVMYSLVDNIEGTSASVEGVAKNYLVPLTGVLENVWKWLKDITTLLKDPIEYAKNALKGIFDGIVGLFEGLNLEKIASILKDTGIGAFFAILAKNLASGAISIASIPSNLSLVLKSLADTISTYQNKINSGSLLNVAKAIGILTLSIIALGSMPPDTLADIVTYMSTLGLIAALIVRVMAIYEKFKKVPEAQQEVVQSFYQFHFEGSDMVKALMEPLMEPFGKFLDGLKLSIDKSLNKLNSSLRIVSLAAGIAIIAKTIIDIYNFIGKVGEEGEDGARKLKETIGFVLIIGGVLATISWILGKQDNKGSVGWALSFVTLAIGLQIVVNVCKQIARWDTNVLNNAWAAVTMAVVALIGISYALHLSQTKMMKLNNGTESKSKNPIMGLALLLLTFSAALLIMTPALMALGTMSGTAFLKAIGVMALFSLVIAGLVVVSQKIGKDSGEIAKGAAAISAVILMVSLMIVVMGAIGTLMKAPGAATSVIFGLIAFIGTLGLLALALWGLKKLKASENLTEFAAAMAKFGLGVAAFSVGVWLFVSTIPALIAGIIAIGAALNNEHTRAAFITGIVALGLAILAAIVLLKSDILSTIAGFIKGVVGTTLNTITSIAKPVLKKITDLITIVAGWFNGKGKIILGAALVILIWALLDFLDGIVPNLVDRLVKIFIIIVNAFSNTIIKRSGQVVNAFKNLLSAILVLLAEVFKDLIKSTFGWIPGIDQLFDKSLETFENHAKEKVDNDLKELQSETDRFADESVKTINNAKGKIEKGTSDPIDWSGSFTGSGNVSVGSVLKPAKASIGSGGFDLTAWLGGGKENIFDNATDAFSAIPDALKEQFGVAELDAETGMGNIAAMLGSTGIEIQSTVDQTSDGVKETTDDTYTHVVTKIDEQGRALKEEVSGIWFDLESTEETGLSNHRRRMANVYDAQTKADIKTNTESAAQGCLVDPLLVTLDNGVESIKKRANLIIEGFVSELKSQYNMSSVWSAGSGLVKHLMGSLDHTAVIKSPSRAAAWRGQMVVAGLVNGVVDNLSQAEMAGATLATSMLSATSSVLEASGDLRPTITPVLNMASVNTGLGYIDGAFGRTTLSTMLASDAFTGFNQNQIFKQEQIENINSTNADVVAALGLLRGDVNNLNTAMNGMQVVMDSGQLVGAIAQPMDNALGKRNTYRGRGI